ncbi:MAG: prepilin-type N-terminal cleavage/methylation domain-containing protein, partial [Planctomycetota bacterium]|nr:prepilin-type N-terminal cleavage/methylation domain-containing protein [Planctomycetota bacterium]
MTTNDEHDGARRGRGSRAGFTLMEVLVTILIIGLMLASVTQILTSVRYTRDTIHNIQEVQLAGPAIMDRLERDLRGIFTINQPREMHLRVMNRVLLGEDADRIDFVTTTDGLEWNYEQDRPLRADYNEVGYCLRTSRADDRFLEMYRREDLGVDEAPLAGGAFTFLHDRVKSFNIEVFAADGPEEEPVEEWGMDPTDEDTQGLPAALRITLTLELAPRILRERLTIARIDRQTVVMTRVIRLPEGLRLAQADIPRLLVPVPPTESDPTPGAGGGEAEPGGLGGDPSGGN